MLFCVSWIWTSAGLGCVFQVPSAVFWWTRTAAVPSWSWAGFCVPSGWSAPPSATTSCSSTSASASSGVSRTPHTLRPLEALVKLFLLEVFWFFLREGHECAYKVCFGKAGQILVTTFVLVVKLTQFGFCASRTENLLSITLRPEVYLKLKSRLLNPSGRICSFFIYLSFTVKINLCFCLLYFFWDLNY